MLVIGGEQLQALECIPYSIHYISLAVCDSTMIWLANCYPKLLYGQCSDTRHLLRIPEYIWL